MATQAVKRHYHVLVGLTGGYMPDSNYPCATLAEARALGSSLARDFSERAGQRYDFKPGRYDSDGNVISPFWAWHGSQRAGYWYSADGNSSVSISVCYESDCWGEDGQLLEGDC